MKQTALIGSYKGQGIIPKIYIKHLVLIFLREFKIIYELGLANFGTCLCMPTKGKNFKWFQV